MTDKFRMPTLLIILGATGDLMKKKIVPALFNLYSNNHLPKMFHVIGLSRRDLSDTSFRDSLRDILEAHGKKDYDAFIRLWTYHKGIFEDLADYHLLARKLGYYDREWKTCSSKLFYVAAPPKYYKPILDNLHQSGLTIPCSPQEGFTRLLIEKPLGEDQATAARLEGMLSKLFKEEQIYRIDHYLAKEMLQNILNFRFSNSLFSGTWSNKHIEKVRIRLWETLGVEKRGFFYDGIGALRDVGQNHLLQMLALTAMDHPGSFATEAIRSQRVKLLKTLRAPTLEEIRKSTYRAQYDNYHAIAGVKDGSRTETYFKVIAYLNHPRWQGVPFILESGKRLKEVRKEIIITFKHPDPCFCPPGSDHKLKNRISFQLEPNEGISVDLLSKKLGLYSGINGRNFQFLIREKGKKPQYVEEYEKLLLDSIIGDQTLFIRSDEVGPMWSFIDPIISAWKNNAVPLKTYGQDTDKPAVESQFIDEGKSRHAYPAIKKEIGIVGLGKMGGAVAQRLTEKGWRVVGYNRSRGDTDRLAQEGLIPSFSLDEFMSKLSKPRTVWLSLPAGKPVDEILFGKGALMDVMEKDDLVIDAGNSFYKDSIRRAGRLREKGIGFMDVGVSGGPSGARYGAALMIGGKPDVFRRHEQLFFDEALSEGYQFFEGTGAGHFVKMVHNGIEYGMMQAIAEGFTLLQSSDYLLDLDRIAQIYDHGSVIESKLIKWLHAAMKLHGQGLENVSGSVGHTGEGQWTVDAARNLKVKTKIIEEALRFRILSQKNPSYTGKILSALREQFGGHRADNSGSSQ